MTSRISCVSLVLISAASFYSGYISPLNDDLINTTPSTSCATLDESSPEVRQRIATRVDEELRRLSGPFIKKKQSQLKSTSDGEIFPKSASGVALGILRVSKAEFLRGFDFGVPNKHKPNENDIDALILYNNPSALPSEITLKNDATHGKLENGSRVIANASVSVALASCDTLNIIFLPLQNSPRNSFPECYVMMSDFESYHINRWMRVPNFATTPKKNDRVLNHSLPLRHVGRITLATKGVDELDVPVLWDDFDDRKKGFLFQHFDAVRTYLENVDSVLKDLKKLLHERKVVRSDNTVIVMTVNNGQSELLSNFICSARRRGLDIGSLLVFPTDIESKILADGLGVATYYDEKNFGRLPSAEAKIYGDPIFCQMMFAKILSVAYVSLLGHDILFQDGM
eukprot:CCRYP_013784-RA/>CCRYP_013784-RA protein AED:0.19 eAED:0.19 QI:142/1/1/1/0/0.5/2/65/398